MVSPLDVTLFCKTCLVLVYASAVYVPSQGRYKLPNCASGFKGLVAIVSPDEC